MKKVKVELTNNNDLQYMFKDLMEEGLSQLDALECVMDEVQIRTIMEHKYKKWTDTETTIYEKGYKKVAKIKMKKWNDL